VLVRRADWRKPTDGDYAFRLRPLDRFLPSIPAAGTRSDVREVAAVALEAGEAERFAARVARWDGLDDVRADGTKPFSAVQLGFREAPARARLDMRDVEGVLGGDVLVLRAEGRVDYVLRDHHTLDVILYEWATRGALPTALFHADRHSDWCRDSFLEARRPDQAATWWKLVEGLKRPGSGAPVLREEDVFFTTARARAGGAGTRDLAEPQPRPWFLSEADVAWTAALDRPGATACDWVSLDLDDFQPSAQLALTKGLLRDARFRSMLARASVRLFVLSPQFTRGGDKIASWTVQGRLHSTLRLLNHLRRLA
jgi:hypothetical protein